MKKHLFFVLIGFLSIGFSACNNNDGCIDSEALNFDPEAEEDDGSCVYLAQNLHFKFNSKLGEIPFQLNTEVESASGRLVKFTIAQMYLGGFNFVKSGGNYKPENSYVLLKSEKTNYDVGHLPEGIYDGFSFNAGVDSADNHVDPATWSSSNALSANNPDHAHWGWDPGYIFYKLEGFVDTSATMNGAVNAPFEIHVGTDMSLVNLAFTKQIESTSEGVTIEMDVDWLSLLNGMDMTTDKSTRVTHTSENLPLSYILISNVDHAFTVHQ